MHSAGGFPANREKYRERGHLLGPITPGSANYYRISLVTGHSRMSPLCQNTEITGPGQGVLANVTGSEPLRLSRCGECLLYPNSGRPATPPKESAIMCQQRTFTGNLSDGLFGLGSF